MTEVSFYLLSDSLPGKLEFVVIVARYQGKWVFVRHKDRMSWEFPGGHIEAGEAPLDAGNRELWEESGALQAHVIPVCIYGVTKEGQTRYGQLFFAEIPELGDLPEDFEMGERLLSETILPALTYPDILPALFHKIQGWLNLQSNAGELWDVYDENRRLTGRIHRRGDPLAKGDYHLVVHVWLLNSRGEFLLTKRSPKKGFPNLWESTGGSALAGDDSLTAALREVKEETGLTLEPDRGERIAVYRKRVFFRDVWLFRQDFDLNHVVLQPGETIDKMYADKDTVTALDRAGKLVPYDYLATLFQAAGLT